MRTSGTRVERIVPTLVDAIEAETSRSEGSTGSRQEHATDAEDVLLDVAEAAAFLRVSPETLKYLRSQRRFAPAIKIGRRVLWLRSDLVSWRNQQRESA